MKTPDEIKRGLECGDCKICSYSDRNNNDGDFHCNEVEGDALAYIQQLERERDALIDHLKVRVVCPMCKHWGQSAVEEPCAWCGSEHNNFEFCGVEDEG